MFKPEILGTASKNCQINLPTDNGGLQVHEDSPGHVLPSSGLGEEGVEAVVSGPDGLVGGHLAIRLNAVLQAVELPAGVTDLATSLADVDRDALTLKVNLSSSN